MTPETPDTSGTPDRFGYQRGARRQLDERALILQGGPLDGHRRDMVAAVGQRVFCGEGPWAMEAVYLVTDQIRVADDVTCNVAVPAFA